MSDGNPTAACPKFAASQKLDPSSGTLLNLASCHEKLGRTASAWATYQEAASLAQSSGRADNLRVAQKRAAALEPGLARVTVKVAEPIDGLEVRRDDVIVTQPEWELAVPIDPGPHTYVAKAPGHETWTGQINVETASEPSGEAAKPVNLTVEIPRLKVLPPAAAESAPQQAQPARDAVAPPEEFWTGRRIAAVASAGVGVVGLGVGAIFAILASGTYDDSLAECPKDKNLCTSAGVSRRDDARTQGNVATAGIIVGGIGLATGAILWFGASSGPAQARVQVQPTVGGITMRGRW
jgi:hypothetical protein